MCIDFFLAWWFIPAVITVVLCGAALLWPENYSGWFAGLHNVFFLIPALFLSMIAWIVAAIFK